MSYLDKRGRWQGFFVDYCRALAAAVLGDANKVKFMPVASNKRFTIVQTGEADVLSRTTTWTLTRDTELGVNFVGIHRAVELDIIHCQRGAIGWNGAEPQGRVHGQRRGPRSGAFAPIQLRRGRQGAGIGPVLHLRAEH